MRVCPATGAATAAAVAEVETAPLFLWAAGVVAPALRDLCCSVGDEGEREAAAAAATAGDEEEGRGEALTGASLQRRRGAAIETTAVLLPLRPLARKATPLLLELFLFFSMGLRLIGFSVGSFLSREEAIQDQLPLSSLSR